MRYSIATGQSNKPNRPLHGAKGRGRYLPKTHPTGPSNHSDGCSVTQSRISTTPTMPPVGSSESSGTGISRAPHTAAKYSRSSAVMRLADAWTATTPRSDVDHERFSMFFHPLTTNHASGCRIEIAFIISAFQNARYSVAACLFRCIYNNPSSLDVNRSNLKDSRTFVA